MRPARQPWLVWSVLLVAVLAPGPGARPQAPATPVPGAPSYSLGVSVDEVVLTFHVADPHSLPITDLKLDELSLLDNRKPPRRVLAFEALPDRPVHAAILIDTSQSMQEHLSGDRKIAIEYAQRLSRQQAGRALLIGFGRQTKLTQAWTSDPAALAASIRKIAGERDGLHGTAIFDTLFSTCLYQFGNGDHSASGNVILLFSDGEDNASYTELKDAVDMCQRANVAVYAFRSEAGPGAASTGPATLAELASETGGRVFHCDRSEDEIGGDLRAIEADLRNRYRLVYQPAEIKHDGSFHRIDLQTPERVERVEVRSGYYAPPH